MLRPESRGTVRIKSADPLPPPAIQPRYLSAQTDRDAMVAGLRALRRIMAAPALAPFIEAEHDPGPACASDDDLLDFARRKGSTVYHPTSTCRMGEDPTAVASCTTGAGSASKRRPAAKSASRWASVRVAKCDDEA